MSAPSVAFVLSVRWEDNDERDAALIAAAREEGRLAGIAEGTEEVATVFRDMAWPGEGEPTKALRVLDVSLVDGRPAFTAELLHDAIASVMQWYRARGRSEMREAAGQVCDRLQQGATKHDPDSAGAFFVAGVQIRDLSDDPSAKPRTP